VSARSVALVTGASRGIGRGIARELARTHTVIATYRGNRAAAESLREECGAEAGVDIVACDIADAASRAALIEHVRVTHGRLDLLVNNAGIAPRERRDLLETTEASYDELMATNAKGPFFLTQAAAPLLIADGGGRVVFVTSVSAYAVSTNRGEYCVSKAALSMTAALYAQRLAAERVLVFEVRPGIIETDMTARVRDAYAERIANGLLPQARMGTPADVARVVRAVADGLLDYSAGTVIGCDGGFHLRSL
jgi:NAD(P)-dependent dehydrogenase (short-subunit alcohol dehydrogenase family)